VRCRLSAALSPGRFDYTLRLDGAEMLISNRTRRQECTTMAKWRIELFDIGREKAGGTIIVDAADLVKAKQQAMRVCRRHLSASGDIYLEAKGHYTYCVVRGWDEVGEVRITCLEACPKEAS